MTKYTKNNNYWNEPTIENSYYAGFIAADGNLHSKQHKLRIVLHEKDRIVLERLKEAIGYTGPILLNRHKAQWVKVENKPGVITEYFLPANEYPRLEISAAQQYYVDLVKHYNIIPNKSMILLPPNITDEEMIKAFIVGYIDGDGQHNPNRRVAKDYYYRYIDATGTLAMVTWIQNNLPTIGGSIQKNGSQKIVKYSGKGADAVYEYLLSTAIEVQALNRKWYYA